MKPFEYWDETTAARKERILRQETDRHSFANDAMELIYSDDLDEIFSELLRLHGIVRDERTKELLDRLFADREGASR